MYPDYSYYTAITFIPTWTIPSYLVMLALLRINAIDYFMFHFLWENGVWEMGFIKNTVAHKAFIFFFFWGYFHVKYTFLLAYYLVEKQGHSNINSRLMTKSLNFFF